MNGSVTETEEVADKPLRVSEETNDGLEDVPEISDVTDVSVQSNDLHDNLWT